jgi:hypothetical protein
MWSIFQRQTIKVRLVGNWRCENVLIISEEPQIFEERPQIVEKGIETLCKRVERIFSNQFRKSRLSARSVETRRTYSFSQKSRLWNLRETAARDCVGLTVRLMRVTLLHVFHFTLLTILFLIPSGYFQSFLQWLDDAKCRSDLSKSGTVVVLVTPSLTYKSTYFKILDSTLFFSVSLRVCVLIGRVLIGD